MDPPETVRGSLWIRGAYFVNRWASLLDTCADRYKANPRAARAISLSAVV